MKSSETTLTSEIRPASKAEAAKTSITISYYLAFIALGLTSASLGPTLFGLAENTQTHLKEISFLFAARSLGYMLGSLLGGRLYDRLPGHPIMGGMVIMMTIGLSIVPTISLLWVLVIVLLAIGVVEGSIDVGGNTLLVWLHRDQVGPYMNALHFFFGVGAFLSPIIIAQALLKTGGITWGYWILALLVFPVSIWLFRVPSPGVRTVTEAGSTGPLNKPLVILLVVFFFLFVAAEVSFGGWIATYVVAKSLATKAEAAYLTAAFWGALTVGRLLSIPIAARFSFKTIVFSDLVGCLFSVAILLIWPDSLMVIWFGSLGIGLAMASLFPASISLAEQSLKVTGQIAGWLLVGAALGGMSLPWLIGQGFESIGPGVVMGAIMIDLVVAVAIFFVLLSQVNRAKMTFD